MHPVIYDVAVSVDGFIAGPDGDISGFAHEGTVVEDYLARLADYAVAIMGRATYEVGYRFGLEPGQNPYPHMRTVVFSDRLQIDRPCAVEVMRRPDVSLIDAIRTKAGGPVYLTGGGRFAAWLLAARQIDVLRVKRAPILLGQGVPLFSAVPAGTQLLCQSTRPYDNGYMFQEYRIAH